MPVRLSTTSLTRSEGNSGSTSFTFTVTRVIDTAGSASVNWQVTEGANPSANGSDFSQGSLPGGVVTFDPGQTSRTITVNVRGDTNIKSDENFVLVLTGATGTTLDPAGIFATATIRNDDAPPPPPTVGLSTTSLSRSEGDSGSTPFTFTVTRSGDRSGTSTVNWQVTEGADPRVSGSDFSQGSLPSGVLTFQPNEASRTITINVAGDTAIEADENFVVVLTGSTGATLDSSALFATAIIRNDDAPPVIGLSTTTLSLAEGNSGATAFSFTVTRSGSLSGTSTVDWQVTEGVEPRVNEADFSQGSFPSGVVTFLNGESTHTITVNVAGDTLFEPNENFVLLLSGATGATLDLSAFFATATIETDDSDDYADEASDGTAPIGTLSAGGSVTGTIGPADANDTYGDKDVFSVSLVQGHSYTIRLQGTNVGGQSLPLGIFTI